MRLRIDEIAVEIGEETQAEHAAEAIRAALAILARRLAANPLHERGLRKAIQLGPVPTDYLAGPGAAARIADDLYRELVRA